MEAKEKNEMERGNFFYVVRGYPLERHILKVKKTRTSAVPQAQESTVPQEVREGEGV